MSLRASVFFFSVFLHKPFPSFDACVDEDVFRGQAPREDNSQDEKGAYCGSSCDALDVVPPFTPETCAFNPLLSAGLLWPPTVRTYITHFW